MSIYSNLKELYKDTNDIVNGKILHGKLFICYKIFPL